MSTANPTRLSTYARRPASTPTVVQRRAAPFNTLGGRIARMTKRERVLAAVARCCQTDGVGVVNGPGGVLPPDLPDAHLAAVKETVRTRW
jgi:hypothetical protein